MHIHCFLPCSTTNEFITTVSYLFSLLHCLAVFVSSSLPHPASATRDVMISLVRQPSLQSCLHSILPAYTHNSAVRVLWDHQRGKSHLPRPLLCCDQPSIPCPSTASLLVEQCHLYLEPSPCRLCIQPARLLAKIHKAQKGMFPTIIPDHYILFCTFTL